jgi:hypothetical protein
MIKGQGFYLGSKKKRLEIYWHTKKCGPYIGYIRKSKLSVNQPQLLA